MLIGPDKDPAIRRASATWSTLNGERLISLRAASPVQQLIDKYLARTGVVPKVVMVLNAPAEKRPASRQTMMPGC